MEEKDVFIILTKSGKDNTYVYGSFWDIEKARKVVKERQEQGINSWIVISTPQ